MGTRFRSLCWNCLAAIACAFAPAVAVAQTDLHITGPKSGFPIALPQLCDAGGGGGEGRPPVSSIPDVISKDLQLSGWFNVLKPNTYLETPGKCVKPAEVKYSDWSIIGAEGVVRGEISRGSGGKLVADLYLHDVAKQQPVIGKRYEFESDNFAQVAHRFANEIVGFFTGEKGIFGTEFAFVSKVGRFSELFAVGIDGSNLRQLTKDRGLVISPSWSPEGDQILYTSYRSRRPELYLIPASGGSPKQVTKDGNMKLGAKFLQSGSVIGSTSYGGDFNIVSWDLRGTLLRRITNSAAIDVSPSMSPDGGSFAFCSNRSGGPQIYISNVGGGEARRISFADSPYCTSPAWSPKGDKIAFVCRQGTNQIFVTSPSGDRTQQLTFSGNNEDPTWSPDGRYLAYSGGGGGSRGISVLPLVSGVPQMIQISQPGAGQPSWGPKID